MFKKVVLGFTLIVLLASTVTFASVDYTQQADELKILGLFSGTDKGYELERAPKRIEGAAMLVRLLGKEEEAKEKMYPHPFKDVPGWANAHIGYMFHHKLTAGVSADRFDSDAFMTGNAYATFVLRALGYDDKIGDFKWDQALSVAVAKGIISASEMGTMEKGFKRNEMVGLSYAALGSEVKGGDGLLLLKLLNDNAVTVINTFKTNLAISDEEKSVAYLQGVATNITQHASTYSFKASDIINLVGDPRHVYGFGTNQINDSFSFMQNYLYLNPLTKTHFKRLMDSGTFDIDPYEFTFTHTRKGTSYISLFDKDLQLQYLIIPMEASSLAGKSTITVTAHKVPESWRNLYKEYDAMFDSAYKLYEPSIIEYPKSILELKTVESPHHQGGMFMEERLFVTDPILLSRIAHFASESTNTADKNHVIGGYITKKHLFKESFHFDNNTPEKGYPLKYGGRFILYMYDKDHNLIGYVNLN